MLKLKNDPICCESINSDKDYCEDDDSSLVLVDENGDEWPVFNILDAKIKYLCDWSSVYVPFNYDICLHTIA
jgi:hypothetical protein